MGDADKRIQQTDEGKNGEIVEFFIECKYELFDASNVLAMNFWNKVMRKMHTLDLSVIECLNPCLFASLRPF